MKKLAEHTENSAKKYGWNQKTNNDYMEYNFDSPEGMSKSIVYDLFPGIRLVFFDIHAKSLPAEPNNYVDSNIYQFNYCVNGRIEFLLDDNTYFYMTENNFAISCQNADSASYFPTNSYQGINIFFDMSMLCHANDNILKIFGFNFSKLSEIYFDKSGTFFAEANQELKILMKKMWELFENPSSFYIQLYSIEFLHLMLSARISAEKRSTFYTCVQVDIAKKAEQLLTADLHKHIPIRQLAAHFAVSETSLKNYFKSVYGQNISDYMCALRMNTAIKLLTETSLSISEISNQVGYTKQGKFAAVFKKYTGMNPLEYRRSKRLETPFT